MADNDYSNYRYITTKDGLRIMSPAHDPWKDTRAGAEEPAAAAPESRVATADAKTLAEARKTASNFDIYVDEDNKPLRGKRTGSRIKGDERDNTTVLRGGENYVEAGPGNDRTTANGGINVIDPGEGNDTTVLRGGHNTVLASEGDDKTLYGDGTNIIHGGDGNDTAAPNKGYLKQRGDAAEKTHTEFTGGKGADNATFVAGEGTSFTFTDFGFTGQEKVIGQDLMSAFTAKKGRAVKNKEVDDVMRIDVSKLGVDAADYAGDENREKLAELLKDQGIKLMSDGVEHRIDTLDAIVNNKGELAIRYTERAANPHER